MTTAHPLAEMGRDLIAAMHAPTRPDPDRVTITDPGLYEIDALDYHADPVPGGSLSSTGARLLTSTCPAIYRHRTMHPEHKDVFDFGTAAHQVVLGTGPELVEVKADDWRTKAARDARDEARAAGQVPLLTKDLVTVHAMAAELADHPVAGRLFDTERGRAELGLFWWEDTASGSVPCRALVDWLPDHVTGRRFVLTDYKTTNGAGPAAFVKDVVNYGYHQQAAWYRRGAAVLGLDPDPGFVFVAQEKAAPFLVEVWELPPEAYQIADRLNLYALETWAACRSADEWPSYTDGVGRLELPGWYVNQHGE